MNVILLAHMREQIELQGLMQMKEGTVPGGRRWEDIKERACTDAVELAFDSVCTLW